MVCVPIKLLLGLKAAIDRRQRRVGGALVGGQLSQRFAQLRGYQVEELPESLTARVGFLARGVQELFDFARQARGVELSRLPLSGEAIAHFRLALAAFEQEGQNDAVVWVLNNLGVLYTREGAYGRAASCGRVLSP